MSATASELRTPDAGPPTGAVEAPLTLTTEPPRPLGFLDQLAMWGNLGISLFGPLTGALVATTTLSTGQQITLDARVVGVGVAAIALLFRAPVLLVVVLAAAAAAITRLAA